MSDDRDWVRPKPDGTWENCSTPDCPNKVCTWATETLCYPCGEKEHGKAYMRDCYILTHGHALDWSDVPGKL